MSTQDTLEHTIALAIAEAQTSLASGYGANSPEIREIARVAVAAMHTWNQGTPPTAESYLHSIATLLSLYEFQHPVEGH